MKIFFLKLTVFIILFFLIDSILGRIIEPFYFKVKSGTIFNTVYGVTNCDEKILIIGASEVKHSFVSKQIEDSLGLSCYNLGFDGNNVYYQYAVLRAIVSRYTPSFVIISTGIAAENESSITPLFPFHKKYKQIEETILEVAPVEKYKLISNAYEYNSLILKIIQGQVASEPYTNGYVPLYDEKYDAKHETRSFSIPSSSRSLEYFDKLLKLAVSAGCKVIVVNTPRCWHNTLSDKPSKIKDLISSNNAYYLNYENDTAYTYHNDIFYDGVHLNNKGAVLFTNNFISDLKTIINKNIRP